MKFLAILIAAAVLLPVFTQTAEAGRRHHVIVKRSCHMPYYRSAYAYPYRYSSRYYASPRYYARPGFSFHVGRYYAPRYYRGGYYGPRFAFSFGRF